MRFIDNPKIAWVGPTEFRRFAGASLCFRNPGTAATQLTSGYYRLDSHPGAINPAPLYMAIHNGLAKDIGIIFALEHGLCPLRMETYHVTMCDLVNDANVGCLHEEFQSQWVRFLQDIPGSLTAPLPKPLLPSDAEFGVPEIRFRFKALELWESDRALVAVLAPVSGTEAAASTIEERRSTIDAAFVGCGKPLNAPWTPHITIGYFASISDLVFAKNYLPRWSADIALRTAQATVSFSRVCLYVFEDMQTYYTPAIGAFHARAA